MSDTINIYNQEQITAAINTLAETIEQNSISLATLKSQLGLTGTNSGDQTLAGLIAANTTPLDMIGQSVLPTRWVCRSTPVDNDWVDVCYGNGLFVAVANTGTGNRAMTSPDGITWTIRTTPVSNYWKGVCYGNGLFVAVAMHIASNDIMTSPDGITWTAHTSPADNDWENICYGNGLFVAVGSNGTGNRVMTPVCYV